jgi:phosphotransferase system enzyme I (PtsI)
MLASSTEIDQTLVMLAQAKESLKDQDVPFDERIEIGGMIEVPAAIIAMDAFLSRLDFLSIGTNDLIQYTLAIDRADEAVSHLYDPWHPAVLRLLADTFAQANSAGKEVSVCGEMAGDPTFTELLLGLGLRCFSMHPSQITAVKQIVLRADTRRCALEAQQILAAEDPERARAELDSGRISARPVTVA